MHADNLRVDGGQRGVIETKLDRQITAQIVEYGVGGLQQIEKDLFAVGLFEVERDRLLVAVERLEEMAVVLAEEIRTNLAADVAALARVLDFDDLGAEIGE